MRGDVVADLWAAQWAAFCEDCAAGPPGSLMLWCMAVRYDHQKALVSKTGMWFLGATYIFMFLACLACLALYHCQSQQDKQATCCSPGHAIKAS